MAGYYELMYFSMDGYSIHGLGRFIHGYTYPTSEMQHTREMCRDRVVELCNNQAIEQEKGTGPLTAKPKNDKVQWLDPKLTGQHVNRRRLTAACHSVGRERHVTATCAYFVTQGAHPSPPQRDVRKNVSSLSSPRCLQWLTLWKEACKIRINVRVLRVP